MKPNRNGFGTVEILLIIIVVGLLGLGGYVVYSNQQEKKDNAALTKKVSQLEKQEVVTRVEADPVPTKSDVEQIREAIGCKATDSSCAIKEKTDGLAWVQSGDEHGGTNYYLAKQGNKWTKIYSGNGEVPQTLVDEYKIPEAWLGPEMGLVQ